MAEVFQLHARSRTHVTYQRRPLESVNQSFADILADRIPARIVLDPGSATTTQRARPRRGCPLGRWSMLDPTTQRLGPHTWVAEPDTRAGLAGLKPQPALISSTTYRPHASQGDGVSTPSCSQMATCTWATGPVASTAMTTSLARNSSRTGRVLS
jgi:hypothetical protein